MLGSKSGYDSLKECFGDLAGHIFAVETGLSSDPRMNSRVKFLDGLTLISNSDAHSPSKLGREANLLNTDKSYQGMFEAIKSRKGFEGTIEFFPEEGKYHLDGHRHCGIRYDPAETQRNEGRCPVCGNPLTVGVLHRLSALADKNESTPASPFEYIVPLPEIISEIKGTGPKSKAVMAQYEKMISAFWQRIFPTSGSPPKRHRKKIRENLCRSHSPPASGPGPPPGRV